MKKKMLVLLIIIALPFILLFAQPDNAQIRHYCQGWIGMAGILGIAGLNKPDYKSGYSRKNLIK